MRDYASSPDLRLQRPDHIKRKAVSEQAAQHPTIEMGAIYKVGIQEQMGMRISEKEAGIAYFFAFRSKYIDNR